MPVGGATIVWGGVMAKGCCNVAPHGGAAGVSMRFKPAGLRGRKEKPCRDRRLLPATGALARLRRLLRLLNSLCEGAWRGGPEVSQGTRGAARFQQGLCMMDEGRYPSVIVLLCCDVH